MNERLVKGLVAFVAGVVFFIVIGKLTQLL